MVFLTLEYSNDSIIEKYSMCLKSFKQIFEYPSALTDAEMLKTLNVIPEYSKLLLRTRVLDCVVNRFPILDSPAFTRYCSCRFFVLGVKYSVDY